MPAIAAMRAFLLVSLLLAAGSCASDRSDTVAERGIGGTGEPARRLADRGIGGTGVDTAGIVGTITGFGSVLVNGLEITYDPHAPILVDGREDGADVLRVGQVAAIEAAGRQSSLVAERIAVRHEVVGPVEAVDAMPGMIQVAGQAVAVSPETRGGLPVRRGEWAAVSGLRSVGGRIVASRIDVRPPSRAIIHGRLEQEPGGAWRIDGARIMAPAGVTLAPGRLVEVSGTYADGVLRATTLQPDVLVADPAAYFGDAVSRLSVERFVAAAAGGIQLGTQTIPIDAPEGAGTRPVIVDLTRGGGGQFTPIGIHPTGAGAPTTPAPGESPPFETGGSGRFAPAPMPLPGTVGARPFGGGGVPLGATGPGPIGRPPMPGAAGGGFVPPGAR